MGYSYPIYEPKYANSIAELMARQGDIQARGAERSGEIWSNAINQIGQLAGNTVQGIIQKKDQQKRNTMIDQAFSSWDPAKPMNTYRRLAVAMDPKSALEMVNGFVAMTKMADAERKGQIPTREDTTASLLAAGAINAKNPDYFRDPQRWTQLRTGIGTGLATHFNYTMGDQPSDDDLKNLSTLYDQFNPTDKKQKTPAQIFEESKAKAAGERAGAPPIERPEKPGSLEQQYIDTAFPNGATPAQLLDVRKKFREAGAPPPPPEKPNDFSSIVRKSESGTPYVSAGDTAGAKEATALSEWSRANGVRFLTKQDADQLTEVQNARLDLQHAYDSVKDLFATNLAGVYLNKGSAKLQATDAGERLAAYKKTLNEASVRLSRATSGGKNLRLNKDLLDKALAAMPNPMSDVAGTAAKGFNESMTYLKNVEDSFIRPNDVALAKNESALSQRYGGR